MRLFGAWITPWGVGVVVVLGVLCGVVVECLLFNPEVSVSTNSGAVHFCSSQGCGTEDVLVDLKSFGEYDDQGTRVKGVKDFGVGSVYALQDTGVGSPVEQHFVVEALAPTDDTTPACKMSAPCGSYPAMFTYQVDRLATAPIPGTSPSTMYSGVDSVVVFTYDFEYWSVATPPNTLVLELQIGFNVDSANPGYTFAEQDLNGYKRFFISDNLFVDFPLAGDPPVLVEITPVGPYGHYKVAMPQTSTERFNYTINLVSHSPGVAQPTTAPPTTIATTTAPPTRPPPTTPAPTASTSNQLIPSTKMNMFATSRSVELCFSRTCDAQAGSVWVFLGELGLSTSPDALINFHTADLNFTAPTTYKNAENITRITSTLDAIVSTSGDNRYHVYPSTDFEASEANKVLLVHLNVSHIWETELNNNIMDSTLAPAGSLKISLNVTSLYATFDFLWLTLYVAASDSQGPIGSTPTTASDESDYTTRVSFGNNVYAKFGMMAPPSYLNAHVDPVMLTDGDYAGLVKMTLSYSNHATSSLVHEGYISSDSSDRAAPSAPTPLFDPSEAVPTASDGSTPPSKVVVLPGGDFGMCVDASCEAPGMRVSLSGLGTIGSNGLESLERVRNAPAFSFNTPEKKTIDGNEVMHSYFTAQIQQKAFGMPHATNSSSSDPTLTVMMDQFLQAGSVITQDMKVNVPRGGVKFSFSLVNWVFPSLSTDRLSMSFSLGALVANPLLQDDATQQFMSSHWQVGSITNGYAFDLLELQDGDFVLVIPRVALVDGTTMVTVDCSYEKVENDGEFVVHMTFPSFTKSLAYDPVLGAKSFFSALRVNNRKGLYVVTEYTWVHCIAMFMLLALTLFTGAGAFAQQFSMNLKLLEIVP